MSWSTNRINNIGRIDSVDRIDNIGRIDPVNRIDNIGRIDRKIEKTNETQQEKIMELMTQKLELIAEENQRLKLENSEMRNNVKKATNIVELQKRFMVIKTGINLANEIETIINKYHLRIITAVLLDREIVSQSVVDRALIYSYKSQNRELKQIMFDVVMISHNRLLWEVEDLYMSGDVNPQIWSQQNRAVVITLLFSPRFAAHHRRMNYDRIISILGL